MERFWLKIIQDFQWTKNRLLNSHVNIAQLHKLCEYISRVGLSLFLSVPLPLQGPAAVNGFEPNLEGHRDWGDRS